MNSEFAEKAKSTAFAILQDSCFQESVLNTVNDPSLFHNTI